MRRTAGPRRVDCVGGVRVIDASLEEASRNLGASPWTCFRTVTLPLALPGLIASAIFVFLESLDEFTGTYFVGVPDVTTLPLLMFNASMGGNYQIASITALLLLLPSIAFMLVVSAFSRRTCWHGGPLVSFSCHTKLMGTASGAVPRTLMRARLDQVSGGPRICSRSSR
jgi:hypothetical protein